MIDNIPWWIAVPVSAGLFVIFAFQIARHTIPNRQKKVNK